MKELSPILIADIEAYLKKCSKKQYNGMFESVLAPERREAEELIKRIEAEYEAQS